MAILKGGLMIKKILVATDGSKTSKKSVEYAVELAKQTGATLILLNVIDKSFFISQSVTDISRPTRLIEPVEDYLRQSAEANLEDADRLCKKNEIQSKKVIRKGHPVEEIIKEANKSKADLVIMGSQGKSALKAAFLGSVTFGVIHKDTKIPVLVVRR
jgi:nucleotide-binding universal stress UspA family protein